MIAEVVVCLAAALASSATSATRAPSDRLEVSAEAMGTTFSLVLVGPDRASLEGAATAAFEEVHRLDRLLSNYRPNSEWSAVNRLAAALELGPGQAPPCQRQILAGGAGSAPG